MEKAKSSSSGSKPRGKSKEFDNFARLAKSLVSVPKKEVEQEREKQEKVKQEKDKPAVPR